MEATREEVLEALRRSLPGIRPEEIKHAMSMLYYQEDSTAGSGSGV